MFIKVSEKKDATSYQHMIERIWRSRTEHNDVPWKALFRDGADTGAGRFQHDLHHEYVHFASAPPPLIVPSCSPLYPIMHSSIPREKPLIHEFPMWLLELTTALCCQHTGPPTTFKLLPKSLWSFFWIMVHLQMPLINHMVRDE